MAAKSKSFSKVCNSNQTEYIMAQYVIYQQKKNQVLSYTLVGESGPDHDKQFDVEVKLNGQVVGTGSGSSKKRAEQAAARAALEKLSAK